MSKKHKLLIVAGVVVLMVLAVTGTALATGFLGANPRTEAGIAASQTTAGDQLRAQARDRVQQQLQDQSCDPTRDQARDQDRLRDGTGDNCSGCGQSEANSVRAQQGQQDRERQQYREEEQDRNQACAQICTEQQTCSEEQTCTEQQLRVHHQTHSKEQTRAQEQTCDQIGGGCPNGAAGFAGAKGGGQAGAGRGAR